MHAPAAHQSDDSICLGILLVLPSLVDLPAALEAAEKAVSGLGALFRVRMTGISAHMLIMLMCWKICV